MRLEYKYLVPNRLLSQVRRAIAPFTVADRHMRGKPGGYTVRSIYLDTADLASYTNKQAGVEARKKIRIRGYDSVRANTNVFLEIKRKQGPFVSKNRAPVADKHLLSLLASGDVERYITSNPGFQKARQDGRRFLFYVYRFALRPAVLIVYEREAYEGHLGFPLRITFDKHVRSALFPALEDLFDEGKLSPTSSGYFILEIKLPKKSMFPTWLKHTIRCFQLRPRALSKYTICLDTHDVSRRSARYAMTTFSQQARNSVRERFSKLGSQRINESTRGQERQAEVAINRWDSSVSKALSPWVNKIIKIRETVTQPPANW